MSFTTAFRPLAMIVTSILYKRAEALKLPAINHVCGPRKWLLCRCKNTPGKRRGLKVYDGQRVPSGWVQLRFEIFNKLQVQVHVIFNQIEFRAFVVCHSAAFHGICNRPAIVLDRFSALLVTPVAQSNPVTPVTDSSVTQNTPGQAVEAANPAWVERPDETHLRCHRRLPWPRHAHNWKGFNFCARWHFYQSFIRWSPSLRPMKHYQQGWAKSFLPICRRKQYTGEPLHIKCEPLRLNVFPPRVHVHVIPDQQHQTFKLVEQV